MLPQILAGKIHRVDPVSKSVGVAWPLRPEAPEATSDRTGPLSQVGFDTTMEDHNFAATFNRRASRSDSTDDAGFYGPMGNFLFCFCAQLERAGPGPERHLGKVQLPAEPAHLLKSCVAMAHVGRWCASS